MPPRVPVLAKAGSLLEFAGLVVAFAGFVLFGVAPVDCGLVTVSFRDFAAGDFELGWVGFSFWVAAAAFFASAAAASC